MHVQKRAHPPKLIARIIDVVSGELTLPPVIVQAGVAILGADVARPTKGDVSAVNVSRFVR